MTTHPIAIIGGGAAGSLLALQLAQRGIRSTIIDRSGAFAKGVAYTAQAPWHRLNVPIEKTGGWTADENARHFQTWYEARHGKFGDTLAERYVPRAAYGQWLSEELGTIVARGLVRLRRAEVTALDTVAEGIDVQLAGQAPLAAQFAVLCLGNHAPRRLAADAGDRVIQDMWADPRMGAIDPGEPVLIVGSGATGIDAMLELHHRGHRGPVMMLSRRGLMPLEDTEPAPYALTRAIAESPPTLRGIVRNLRAEAVAALESGRTWQSMIDAVRGELTAAWPRLSASDQRRYVRHLRAYWLVHRHRLAPDIAELARRRLGEGWLRIVKGGFVRARHTPAGLIADIRRRDGSPAQLDVGWVINCTGPCDDFRRLDAPLIKCLLSSGTARPSALGPGLDVGGDARLISLTGQASDRIFVLGGATWPRFGEVTSAPQIRRRATLLTDVLAKALGQQGGPHDAK